MKALRILSLGIFTILLTCTVEGNPFDSGATYDWKARDPHYGNDTFFTPPEWIKGVWYADSTNAIKFTNTDIINYHWDKIKGWVGSSKNRQLNFIEWGEHKYSFLEETITDTTYYFSYEKKIWGSNPVYNTLYQKIPNDSLICRRSGETNWTTKYGKRN